MTSVQNHSDPEKIIAELAKKVESFRKEKENYRTLFDSLLFGIQEIDTRGTIIYANAAHHKIHGYDDGELINTSMLEFSPTEKDREELAAYLDYLVKDQPPPTSWLGTDRRKDGTLVDVKIDWNYKRNNEGKIVGFISLITDITEQIKLQKELQASEGKFQSIFKHSPLAIMHTDVSGTITTCNENATKLFGAPEKKLIGFSYKDIKDERMRNAIADALAGKDSSFKGEYRTVTGNVLTQLKANFSPSFYEDGTVSGVIGIFEDISESRKNEREIARRKAEFEAIFNAISDAVVFVDQQRHILMINKAFTDLFGYRLKDVIGKTTQFFYADPEDYQDQGRKRYHTDARADSPVYEIEYRRKDGTVFPSETLGAHVRDDDGNILGFIGVMRDITKRKKAELALRESEEKFRLLMDSLESIVYVADMDTYEVLFINKYGRDLAGDVSGRICWQSLQVGQNGPCEFCTNKHIVDAAGNPGPAYTWEFENKKIGRWFHIIDRAIKWIDGRIVRLEIATDITENKKTEMALRESEEKYSKIFNNEIDAIVIFDGETQQLVDANTAFLTLYGYTRKEALNLRAEDISAEPEKTISTIKKTAREGNLRIRRRIHRKKNGEKLVVDIGAFPIMLQDRKVIFSRIQDITEHVKAEKELNELEERFRVAFQTSPDAININKPDGTYVEINQGFTGLTGYTREDVIGRSSLEINIWDNLEDRKTLLEGLQKSGHVANLEAKFRMKDGSSKTGLMSANLIHLHGEPHILSITRDITSRKQAELEKIKLETQLRQVYKMEAIGTMAGGIAHDFNNILTIILGNADLARYVTKEDGPARQYIDQILEASGRAREMVRQILAFSRQAKQDMVPVKPHMVFNETLQLLRSTIPTTVDIQQNLNPKCRAISADPTQLNQVLMNLCANAVHAMNEKGTLKVSLQEVELGGDDTRHKPTLQPGPYARLSVTDTGRGMAPELKERIFDPFFTTKKVGEGTGMGLSVVHGIVESHRGMISVESTPGKGTTFNIYFPVVDESVEVIRNMAPLQYKGDEHILFVDDEESLVELAVEMLRLHGYRVTSKTSGVEALKAFKKNPGSYDLVITDQTMPILTGAEMAVELLKIRPDIPIVLCTGYSSKISDEMAKKIGIADYFMKPFDTQQLAMIVRNVLDRNKDTAA